MASLRIDAKKSDEPITPGNNCCCAIGEVSPLGGVRIRGVGREHNGKEFGGDHGEDEGHPRKERRSNTPRSSGHYQAGGVVTRS